MKISQILTNEDVVNLVGNSKQIATFNKNKKLTEPSKTAILKKLESICRFEKIKIGRKVGYKVIEIYDTKKEIEDKRKNNKGGNNKVFVDDFKKIIIDVMYKNKTEEMLLSKTAMFKTANLINDNYKIGRNNIEKLSKLLNTPQNLIYEFYDNNHSKLKKTVETSLRNCRSKSILMYEEVVAIAINKANIVKNELGEPIIENGKIKYETILEYREATKDEKQLILNYEEKVKSDLGFDENASEQELYLSGKWKEFKKKVEKELRNKGTNINFYYKAYKLTWNNKTIEKMHNRYCSDLGDLMLAKNNINKNIVDSINKTNKTIKRNKIKNNKEVHEDYDEHNNKLTNTLIDHKAKNIEEELMSIN